MAAHYTASQQRAWRVATKRQSSVPIPVAVLAKLLDRPEVIEAIGTEMVAAVRKAVQP